MKKISENKAFSGAQQVYSHFSKSNDCEMTFGIFLPEEASNNKVPILWYLSGLTCTHENAMTKSGAQVWAAEQGIALIFPDTSPRGDKIPDDQAFDLGQGAGFYVNATNDPWSKNFNMWDYITDELPELIFNDFSLDEDRQSIMGHSMGGHGALTMAFTFPKTYRSVSAFSPITNPTKSDWGIKQFTAYLGEDQVKWQDYDASLLLQKNGFPGPILIDQGSADQFWDLLRPNAISEAMIEKKQTGVYRIQEGYDHSYFFISSFMEEHISFHAEALYR